MPFEIKFELEKFSERELIKKIYELILSNRQVIDVKVEQAFYDFQLSLRKYIYDETVVKAIMQGKGRFYSQIGINPADSRFIKVIEFWLSRFKLENKSNTRELAYNIVWTGGGDEDFRYLTNLPGASFISEGAYRNPLGKGQQVDYGPNITQSSTEANYKVPWLEWIMFRGTERVVSGYEFATHKKGRSFAEFSRTEKGIMLKNKSAGFGVDPVYAGTAEDNFFTRALARGLKRFELLVSRIRIS